MAHSQSLHALRKAGLPATMSQGLVRTTVREFHYIFSEDFFHAVVHSHDGAETCGV